VCGAKKRANVTMRCRLKCEQVRCRSEVVGWRWDRTRDGPWVASDHTAGQAAHNRFGNMQSIHVKVKVKVLMTSISICDGKHESSTTDNPVYASADEP
jgi:hypothetical protein